MSRHKNHLKDLAYMASQGYDLESVKYGSDRLHWSKEKGGIRKSPNGDGFLFYHPMMNLWTSTPALSDRGYGEDIDGISHFAPTFVFSKDGQSFELKGWKQLGYFICAKSNADADRKIQEIPSPQI